MQQGVDSQLVMTNTFSLQHVNITPEMPAVDTHQ